MAIMGHSGRWLRHKKDGTIYNYNDVLCKNPAVEEIPEELAFPERFIPEAQRGRKSVVDLGTDPEVIEKTKPKKAKRAELSADASKGLKK